MADAICKTDYTDLKWNNIKWNVAHDIITRDANIVSWAKICEFSKSQRDIIGAVIISKIIAFDMIITRDLYVCVCVCLFACLSVCLSMFVTIFVRTI